MWMHVDAFSYLNSVAEVFAEFRRDVFWPLFEVGPTYTLCFWGISQWLDKLNWQATRGKSKCHQLLFAPNDFCKKIGN